MAAMKLRPHPMETEVDRVISELDGDLQTMKTITDTGTIYNFNSDNILTYICLPIYVPNTQNLFRLECEIGSVDAKEVGRVLVAVSLDLDMNCQHPIRLVPRTKDGKTYTFLVQVVCSVDLVQSGFIAQTILCCVELASSYSQEFLTQDKAS